MALALAFRHKPKALANAAYVPYGRSRAGGTVKKYHQVIIFPALPSLLLLFSNRIKHVTMKVLRQSLPWLPILVSQATAITPLQAIASYPQLSTLQTYITASSNFSSLLTNANNFTFFAPNNDAWAAFANQNGNITNSALLEATLNYSLLLGGYPALSFSNTSQFVPTNLVNGTYTNVTGGQRVELLLGSDGTPQVLTSNKTISASTSTVRRENLTRISQNTN